MVCKVFAPLAFNIRQYKFPDAVMPLGGKHEKFISIFSK